MKREVKFKETMLALVGPQLKPGDKAPDFACAEMLDVVTLAKTPATARLFSVVPSLDTPVCNQQTHKFDTAVAGMKDKVTSYTVSLDMPFAQKRFCTTENITNMKSLSDLHNGSFGKNYGVLIEEIGRAAAVAGQSSWSTSTGKITLCRVRAGSRRAPQLRQGDRSFEGGGWLIAWAWMKCQSFLCLWTARSPWSMAGEPSPSAILTASTSDIKRFLPS